MERIREYLHSGEADELALVNHSQEVDDWALADAMNDADIAVLAHEFSELRAIDAALLRIKTGTYGVCMECEDAIAAERLSAQPAAEYCIGCQEQIETRKGAMHSAML